MDKINNYLQNNLNRMMATGKLFISSFDMVDFIYKQSMPHDQIFKVNSIFDCNICNNFLRRYGNIVAIEVYKKDGVNRFQLLTLFDGIAPEEEYIETFKILRERLLESKIKDVFFETFDELNSLPYQRINRTTEKFQLGTAQNTRTYTAAELANYKCSIVPGKVYEFKHFHVMLDSSFVDKSGSSIAAIQNNFRSDYEVFERAMSEIPLDTYILVSDLINQGSFLGITPYKSKFEAFFKFSKDYNTLPNEFEKHLFCWFTSYRLPFAKFKNELLGVTCTDIAEGKDLNVVWLEWNKRSDPKNYMKAAPPKTQKQIDSAKKFISENGYEDSFNRRVAVVGDIKVDFINHISPEGINPVSVFDQIKPSGTGRHKRSEFDNIEEVNIEKFMKDILPTCSSVEVFLDSSLEKNFVTMHTAINPESKQIFKWPNNFAWTYKGNLTGVSRIKEAVKERGGGIGEVNIRLAFPETTSDYDLHLKEPNGDHIYYQNRRRQSKYGGTLDLDANGIDGAQVPDKRVENITYATTQNMKNGKYQIYVHNWSKRDSMGGFELEVEIFGETRTFSFPKVLNDGEAVEVGYLVVKNTTDITFEPNSQMVEGIGSSMDIYGLKAGEFHPASLICLSPNYWNSNVGNKHYFFMLQKCHVNEPISSFHNEFMISDFHKDRNVLEVFSSLTKISGDNVPGELSGLGFDSTIKNSLILRLKGSFKRTIKVTF